MTFSQLQKSGIEDINQKEVWKLESELEKLGFKSDYCSTCVRLSKYSKGHLTQVFIGEKNKYSGLFTVRIL